MELLCEKSRIASEERKKCKKVNHLSKVIWGRKNKFHQICQFHQHKSSETNTLADGLIKRTLYMLDQTVSKTVHKDDEGDQ